MNRILILLFTFLPLSGTLLAELTLNFDVSAKEFYLTGSDTGTASDENILNYGDYNQPMLDIDYEGDKYTSLSSATYTDIEGSGRTLFTDSGLYLLNNEVPPPGNILWLSGENYDDDPFINLRLAFSPPSSNQVKITGTGLRASYANLNPDLINDIENNNGLKLDLIDGAGFSDVLIRVHNKYSGIYEGNFEEYLPPPDGYDYGIFLAHVDANNNVTIWNGNEYWGDKYRFKIDEQGRGSFRSSGGYNVTVQFSSNGAQSSSNGGITITMDKGASASVSNVTRFNYPYTPGAVSLQEDLMANPAYNSGTQVNLDLNSSLPFESTTYTLEDQLSLLSGEWSVTAKMSLNDYYGTKVSATGDFIFTQNSLYFYGKARGESLLIRQDATISGYNDVNLISAAYDFNKRTISASGAVIIQDYTGTVTYTAKQKVSYFDTDDDSLSDYEEINIYSTDPLKADSDGDRMSDYAELAAGTNPTDKSVYPAYLKVQVSLAQGIIADSDADATVSIDGEPYAVSLVRGKGTLEVAMPIGSTYTVSASRGDLTSGDPRSVLLNRAATVSLVLDGDSDGDGLPDSLEARYKGDPNDEDTDDDGILDGAEVNTHRTRVDVADTDKDGLNDYDEINNYGTDALKADSDGDRMSDYAELQAGTDPSDKSVYPAYLKVQVSLAKGITADSDADATVSIDGEPYAVSLVRGKGTLEVAMPIGSTYTVSASRGDLTSGDPRSVLLNRAATVSLVLDGDSDGDGLPDSLEARYKGDPNDEDTDDDGILDGAEVNTHRTRVDVADTDKDGLNDYEEINIYSTDPLKADSDGDRMSDYAELAAGTNPTDKSVYPAYLKVQVSLAQGIIADSDADATVSIDGEPYAVSLVRGKGTLEVAMPIGSTYTVSASRGDLTSGDPRSVLLNRAATVSLVLDGDSDGDGLPDSLEARYKGDPNDEDTDDDGILDGAEVNTHRTRVDVADTDKDGLNDYDEINNYGTDALKADSDGDRMSDYAELQAGTDPSDKSVYPAYLKVQVSLAKGITADSDADATVSIDGEPYAVSLVRGKGTLEVAMPIGSTYTVSASRGDLTSGDPRSVLLNRAATVSLVLDGDSDGDGLPDSLEARYKGDPNDEDTDDDGILDGAEVNTYGTRVDVADTDKDGFTDKQELDLNTNPLSSKDKPEAYIQRPVLVDLNLTYESANGYIVEKWDTAEMAYFLSSAVKDPQQGASIYLKYSLDGSNLKWIVRANGVDIDVSSLMRPIKVSKPAQLDGEVLSSINPLSGTYSVTQMFSLAISAGRTKSLSLVVSGESSFSAVGPNVSGLELDLATSSDYKALGMLKDPSRSNGPILIEGTLTMGDELANVLGQIIGSVETK